MDGFRNMDSTSDSHADVGAGPVRRRLSVRGRVQGVGFRPFVSRLATELGLAGFVGNDMRGAFIEVEGAAGVVEMFATRLQQELPPLARITTIRAVQLPPEHQRGFHIDLSSAEGVQAAEVTPDVGTCDDCLAELADPADRRYRYPFINCTNCGPRYSIIHAVPYDRPNTTMAAFAMCPACQSEYDDPADRRFHAQPNACSVCGPCVRLVAPSGEDIGGDDAVATCAAMLQAGKILAIKGLGGFHLACRADDDQAVAALRVRKARETKPLAVMVASVESAGQCVRLDEATRGALTSPVRPIVLAPKRDGAPLSRHVAPGTDRFGVMLPYTPLHELLFAEGVGSLVMTSGNPSDEPLCADNGEALRRLGPMAHALLMHNRDIDRPIDDSVVAAATVVTPAGRTDRVQPMRRARGYVPGPVEVRVATERPILAVGGGMKSTVCLLSGSSAVVSEHLGKLTNPCAYRNFLVAIGRLGSLLQLTPGAVAHDMHPDYPATRYARELGLPATAVQHHHAHVVSCMADNGLTGRVVGVVCDGTGYGLDGAAWGCEVLVADAARFQRAAHLRYFALPGGDAAAIETWRPAASLLAEAFGPEWRQAGRHALARVGPDALALTERRLAVGAKMPRTSSLGRLFDAGACLLGICGRNDHEARAAMAVEAAAREAGAAEPFAYDIIPQAGDGPMQFDVRPMIRELAHASRANADVPLLARRFHETIAAGLADCAVATAAAEGLDRVVLSGGCFSNGLLMELLSRRLSAEDCRVFIHKQVPAGDGGIALGQAVVAAALAATPLR